MTARERIQQEVDRWFLTEPQFFAVYCTHGLTMNPNMLCALRTGQGRIEYNPTLIDRCDDALLHELLRAEMIRILLGHPYARQPLGCAPEVRQMASDTVIAPAYHFAQINVLKPGDVGLPEGEHYEWYAHRLSEMAAQTNGLNDNAEQRVSEALSDNSQDYAALWEEDTFTARQIADLIQSTTQWGSIPGRLVEIIKKSAQGRIEYQNILRGFRSTVLSQKRHLTRMRPSRRFGLDQMGSQRDYDTAILVAIDTSASVSSEGLGRYFHVITTFFKYGIQRIDVIMFDAALQGDVMTIDQAKKGKHEFQVMGRGGTDFQVPIDFVAEYPDYNGLIIFTDGYADPPEIPPHFRTKLLWVIDNEPSYKKNHAVLRQSGRVCLMKL